MAKSRREFLQVAAMGAVGTAVVSGADAQVPQTPGAPPAWGAAPAVGPKVTPTTFAEAEKLTQTDMLPEDRVQAAESWPRTMGGLFERRVGPRRFALRDTDTPASLWLPAITQEATGKQSEHMQAATAVAVPLPTNEADIAFAPLHMQARWIASKQLTSERLTRVYLARLKRYQPVLNCTITLCEEHALEQARAADREIAAGRYRGALHGIPWGAKDLLDTKGIATTWGAEFAQTRVPAADAAVVEKLNAAGAVLVAKLSLGALALNDVWFGGQTKNPWNTDEGASGSSAGPGSAVGAGLVSFAIGSETQGSIISPSTRCGVTGLRPTYGRVSRAGAMTLSWTCDKLGPMARSVEDTMLVLHAISGFDERDTASVQQTELSWAYGKPVSEMRVGYVAKWMQEAPATEVDRHALQTLRTMGVQLVPVELPDRPYDSLNVILFAEAAAAFEQETLDGRVRQLRMQTADAWPNLFRQARFLSAVDYVQADRLRRRVAGEVAQMFEGIDVLLTPSLRDEPMVIFNFTGHPSLTLRAGFVEVSEERSDWAQDLARPLKKFSPARRVPHGVTLVGKLFDEGTLGRLGMELERAFGVSDERPKGFS